MSKTVDVVVMSHGDRPVPAQAVRALYRAQDWWPDRTDQQIDTVLADAPAVGAWRNDELVGFARAVTDGVLRAYVEDVVVSPQLRGTGVGRAIVECLLGQLQDVPTVSLFCSRQLVSFYERLDFQATRQIVLHRM